MATLKAAAMQGMNRLIVIPFDVLCVVVVSSNLVAPDSILRLGLQIFQANPMHGEAQR
jgi:hypothetical protein